MRLPHCDSRVETPRERTFFCRHTGVIAPNNLVSPAVCRSCRARTSACAEPRPVPPDEELFADRAPSESPPMITQVWNLATSLAAFAADGFQTVSKAEYEERLRVCDTCAERRNNRCLQCGCRLTLKAQGRAFRCPLDKWPNAREAPGLC